MRNISPVVKDDDIEKKKHTHSVSDISDFPEIPDETAISGMGFTKNSGDYSKPNGGIPKSDLASAVQTSLSKADTALQEHQSLAEYVKADDARLTDARPANGGNAETVNGHTINADVPSDAVFTDTVEYKDAFGSSISLDDACDAPVINLKLYGKSTQKRYSGKNLYQGTKSSPKSSNGWYCILGGVDSITLATEDYKIPYGEKLTLSLKYEGNLYTSINYKKDGKFTELVDKTSLKQITFTIPVDYDELFIFSRNGTSNSFEISDIQIEKGSTATSYEPYVGGVPSPNPDYPQDIVSVGDNGSVDVKSCGKNLLNYDAWKTNNVISHGTAIFENNGVTITATENDAYTNYTFSSFPYLARVFVVEGETITLSWEESTNTSGRVFIFPYGKVDGHGHVYGNNKVQKKLTYTVPSGVSYITFRFGVDLAGDTISYKNIMIERGSEATEFEPYKDNTATITSALPLCGIPVSSGGNYTDSNGHQWICDELIYNADGTGKIIKRTNKKVLSTNDTFYFYNDKSPRIVFRVSDILKISNSSLKANLLCNNHQVTTENAQYSNANVVGISQQGANSTKVYISNANTNSVDAFKTWLADNPTYIIYPLAEPQEIALTSAEMATLKQLQTYNGVTSISNDGNADMYVKYWRDETIPSLINNTKYDDATTTKSGLMSAADKKKLDEMAAVSMPMQKGTVTLTTGTQQGVQLTFPTPFKSAPLLLLSIEDEGYDANYRTESVTFDNLSKTGAHIRAWYAGNTSHDLPCTVHWAAFGEIEV